jgi:hypothetical protein
MAVLEALPTLPWKEASAEAVNAVAFATPVVRTTDQGGISQIRACPMSSYAPPPPRLCLIFHHRSEPKGTLSRRFSK